MKLILPFLFLILISSFTLWAPKKEFVYKSPDLDKLMVYFPHMTISYREADTIIIDDALVFTNTYSIKPFYMFPYEVSNGQYLEFINHLKEKGDTTWKAALPDTLVWRSDFSYNEPYVEYYLRHPAYSDYPVVGLTHAQCMKYCEWLTSKYNSTEKRKFKEVKFRLPTKYEWYAAAVYRKPAKGEKEAEGNISYYDDNLFPWNGFYMRNKEGGYQANFLAIEESSVHREYDSVMTIYGTKAIRKRYVGVTGTYMGTAGSLNDVADITAPVHSYWANDAGIFCLAGNVEEFVAEYGITKGGSWRDPGYYLRNTVVEPYDASNEKSGARGFRFVMEVMEE